MTEAEQFRLTRWGIPGWIAILSAFGFAFIDIALSSPSGQTPLHESLMELFRSTSTMSAAVAVVLAAAAGVPLGFCIYQAYFWLRWNSPVSRDGFLPPLVAGREDDLDRTMRDFTEAEIVRGERWRERWVTHALFRMDHGWRWRYIENLFTEATQQIDSELRGVSIFDRHRSLLDHMHTLGAGLAGIYLGYLGYTLAKARLQSAPFTLNLLLTALPLGMLLILLAWEDRTKKAVEFGPTAHRPCRGDRLASRIPHTGVLVSDPSVMFILVVFSFLYAGSPSPYSPTSANPLPMRIIIPGGLLAAWYIAKARWPRRIRVTETALLGVFTVLAYLIGVSPRIAALSPDWPFYWSILAFMLANLAFLKNRQNARDDLIALEYYTLRRFLNEQQGQGVSPREPEEP